MSSYFTDSMARDHASTMQATARAQRRARVARDARRDARRAERLLAGSQHHRVSSVGHAAVRPLAAVRHWLVAGQL